MKNLFNFKWLLLSFILSIASINQVWANTTITFTDDYLYFNQHNLESGGQNKCSVEWWMDASAYAFVNEYGVAGAPGLGNRHQVEIDNVKKIYRTQFKAGSANTFQLVRGPQTGDPWNYTQALDAGNFSNGKNYIWTTWSDDKATWCFSYYAEDAYLYFDNSKAGWTSNETNHIFLTIGRYNYTAAGYQMTNIPNTNLYYFRVQKWDDYDRYRFVNDDAYNEHYSAMQDEPSVDGYTDIVENSTDVLLRYQTCNVYTFDGTNGNPVTKSEKSDYSGLNYTQTIESYVKTGTGAYTKANTLVSITTSSYVLNSATTSTTSSNPTMSTSASQVTFSAAHAATTTLSLNLASVPTGYDFAGWYDEDGNRLSPNASYTYYPTGATTVRAYFSQTHTVEFETGVHGTVSPTGNQAVGQRGVTITASSPDTHYRFGRWICTGGASVANQYAAETTVTATSGGSVRAHFCSEWAIKGSMSNDEWATFYDMPYDATKSEELSANIWRGKIKLAANSTYTFKVKDAKEDKDHGWYGRNSAFIGQTTYHTMSADEGVCHLLTAEAGEYIFEFNSDNKQLTVTYPVITHPSVNYVYFRDYDENWAAVRVHIWRNSPAEDADSSPGPSPTSFTFDDETYYYVAIGDMDRAKFSDGVSYATGDLSDLTLGHWFKTTGSPYWNTFTVTINFNRQGTVTSDGTTSLDVDFNDEALSRITPPTWTGYTFEGYYNTAACNDKRVIDENGDWIANVEGYTTPLVDSKIKWIKDGPTNTLYAKWTPVTLTLTTTGNWSESSKWSPACVPTINHPVVIAKPVEVNSFAFAKSVVIDQNSTNTGHLTINAGKSLVIAETLQKKNSSGDLVDTEEADVLIDSHKTNGNGALVIGSYSNSHNNEATVNFATLAYKDNTRGWVNQYIGTPFKNQGDPTYNYYGMQVYAFDADTKDWESSLATSMTAFHGYTLLSRSESQDVMLNMTGTLVASEDQNLEQTGVNVKGSEAMFANSWVAPIEISELAGAFTGSASTIYIFNAGSPSDFETNGASYGALAGQYQTIPVASIPDGYTTIPSMQAFSVYATASTVQIALNYENHVYTPALSRASIEPAHAPRRTPVAKPTEMQIGVRGVSGYGDYLRILEREDYTTGFDDGHEGHKLFGYPETPQLFTIEEDGKMAVSAVPEIDGMVLGFQKGTEDSQYTFSFNYDGEETFYLNDMKEEKSVMMSEENTYDFTSAESDNVARFTISKSPVFKTPTSVETIVDGINARKLLIDGTLYIVRDGRIYDAIGNVVK